MLLRGFYTKRLMFWFMKEVVLSYAKCYGMAGR